MASMLISRARVALMKGRKTDALVIGITGTPGVGKSYFSKKLFDKLRSAGIAAKIIEINDVVNSENAYGEIDELGSKIIKPDVLRRSMKKAVRKDKICIVVGHLLPETGLRPKICIVLRQSLHVLEKRMEGRRYAKAKIRENLLAEAYDDIGVRMKGKCDELFEAESDEERERLMRYLIAVASGTKSKKPKSREIDKFAELERLILDGNRLGF
ncbi:putative kinase [Candidatus Micrarchaeum sp.]|jgi:broad-specificity NMP kinase|nr:putative kinase [Candidatus Micrarchaeum sp.]